MKKSVVFVLPLVNVDDSILADSISAYVGAKSCSEQIVIQPYAVEYECLDDEKFNSIISYVRDARNSCIGIIVYGESPSYNLFQKLCENRLADIPVVAVACVSEFKCKVAGFGMQYYNFAFRMWFDVPSLVYTIKQMLVDVPKWSDDGLLIVYNDNEYGRSVKERLLNVLAKSGRKIKAIEHGRLKKELEKGSDFAGIVLTGFGRAYDESLSILDANQYPGLIFTDNYLTDKHYRTNLRICGLVVDDAVPNIEFSKELDSLKKQLKQDVSITSATNSQSSMGVEPPIYFASRDTVTFLTELLNAYHKRSQSDDDLVKVREFVIRCFQKKQYKNISLGMAMIQPLGECKIAIRYKWIGPIDFEFNRHVIPAQENLASLFDEVESSIMSSDSVGRLSRDICDVIYEKLNRQLGVEFMGLVDLPDKNFNRYCNNQPVTSSRQETDAFFERELGPEICLAKIFKFMGSRIPIQINRSGRILADNDALCLYEVSKDNNVSPISSEKYSKPDVSGFVFAKTRLLASYLWSKRDANDGDDFLAAMRREDGLVFVKENVHVSSSVVGDEGVFNTLLECMPALLTHAGDGYEYVIPEVVSRKEETDRDTDAEKKCAFAVFRSSRKLSKLEVAALINLTYRMFSLSYISSYITTNKIANTKSAIGSIMSRNGSHNIGSHVLAALSHNVGTMPDDRVLYQYIQHRMDYIATATTEFPTWRQPTLFVNEVVKAFLCQKHLLNYIARSEGLGAYQFQNPTIGCDSEQFKTIRIHVRRLKKLVGVYDALENENLRVYDVSQGMVETSFVLYPGDAGFQKDGLWNAHLEKDIEIAIPGGEVGQHALFTIIENVIRNAAKHAWAKLPQKDDRHLNVYLDFNDNPEKGVVEFLVWTEGEISQEQRDQLVEKMGRKFISDDGKLQKENWGFAEMRISAGYLKSAKIRTIGGLDGAEACHDLICPVLVSPDGEKGDRTRGYLGFRFDVYKPRELLILMESQLKGYDVQRNLLRQYGVWIMSKEEATKESALPFSYVLLENFDGNKDANAMKLPFRIICEGKVENVTNPNANLFPLMAKKDRVIANIKKRLDGVSKDSDAKCLAKEFLEKIYCCWVLHLKNIARQCGRDVPEDEPLPIVIDVAEDSSPEGSGKGLVDTPDLMRFVLENTLNAALRSYLERCKDGTNVCNAWNYILKMRPRPVLPLDQLISGGRGVKSMLAQQINDWYINAEVDTSDFECLVSGEKLSSNLTGFSEFLQNVILTQAESFLSKYEERFVTLPKSFGTTPPPKAWKKNEDWESAKVSLLFTSDDETRNGFGHSCLAYWRHYTFVPRDPKREKDEPAYKKLVANQNRLYLEPLSGAQSYLNTIIALGRTFRDDPLSGHRLLTSLIETGLQRVLIIDERVSKFLQDHVDVKLTFDHIGVSAMCDTTDDVIKLFKAYKPDDDGSSIPAKSSVLDYEIVIIHMGIIDKLLPHHESKEAVEGFVKYLKRSLRYVVVTTGRGTPSNLPDDSRVLPFSVVESTMFKKYPEKMILVANVMNVLPVNKEDGQ